MKALDVKATVRITGPLTVFDHLRRIDLRKTFRELGKPTRIDQRQHHVAERGPAHRWPALAASTIARNRYPRATKGRKRAGGRWRKKLPSISAVMGRKLLRRLPAALISRASSHSLIVFSRVRWSGVHQEGGRAGHGARIPQRQFLWISPWLVRYAIAAFERALAATAAKVP